MASVKTEKCYRYSSVVNSAFKSWVVTSLTCIFCRKLIPNILDTLIYPSLASEWFQSELCQQLQLIIAVSLSIRLHCMHRTVHPQRHTPFMGKLTGHHGHRGLLAHLSAKFSVILIAVPLTSTVEPRYKEVGYL